ncbi:MAG TPA: hypothetical protein EYQ50_25645 [Verrucomicrobiales bacterium]|nr:hypothetical protein [Verrucomicrobiales bacterium]
MSGHYGVESFHRTVTSGGSFGASPLTQSVGLGTNAEIQRVEISWPAGGKNQTYHDLKANQFYVVHEGKSELEQIPTHPFKLRVSHRHTSKPN